jgi:microtubule-associated protein-like 4
MSIIQWKLVEKLPVPQNEVITDASVTKTPASSSETARPSNSPPLPPSLPLTGTAEEESRMGSSPTLVENSLEQIAEPSEEQSEWGSEDLGVVIDEEPASELSETQGATELPEEERGITPLC